MKQVKKKLHAEWEVISSAEWLENITNRDGEG